MGRKVKNRLSLLTSSQVLAENVSKSLKLINSLAGISMESLCTIPAAKFTTTCTYLPYPSMSFVNIPGIDHFILSM